MNALYHAVVACARRPKWYRDGGVADVIDGRFDMLALVMSLVLMRLDGEGESMRQPAVDLAERFIDDMDGELRQIGIGDFVVGKHIGRMMGALGGRLGAYRAGLEGQEPLEQVLVRNLYRGNPPATGALSFMVDEVKALHRQVMSVPLDQLVEGRLPE